MCFLFLQLQAEVQRLEVLKMQSMKSITEAIRAEIALFWERCFYSQEQRQAFVPYHNGEKLLFTDKTFSALNICGLLFSHRGSVCFNACFFPQMISQRSFSTGTRLRSRTWRSILRTTKSCFRESQNGRRTGPCTWSLMWVLNSWL